MRPRRIAAPQAAACTQAMLDELARGEPLTTVEAAQVAGIETDDARKLLEALVIIGAVVRDPNSLKVMRFALPQDVGAFEPERQAVAPPPLWARSVFDWADRP